MLHAITEIRQRLQGNISISFETLIYAGRGVVVVHFLPESQYLAS